MSDTIYALATPPGRSGVAVVRVSGGEAFSGLLRVTGSDSVQSFPDRRAVLRTLRHPVSRETIDQALILCFRGPASYTGEDVVEYHLHGGRAVLSALFDILSSFKNYRMALPGEFTRRAFESGRMDLVEAEAVADLIDAETQAQRSQALAQMGGALTALYEGWRNRLVRALAHMEADLDFSDEALPEGIPERIFQDLVGLIQDIEAHLDDARRGERLRDGIRVVVLGAPNAGKSTLVNAMAQREVAIVSDLPGTTRDILEVPLDLGGFPVLLSDTAGLRDRRALSPEVLEGDAHARIEAEGIRRARRQAEQADIRIFLFDATLDPQMDSETLFLKTVLEQEFPAPLGDLFVLNKVELCEKVAFLSLQDGAEMLEISAQTGLGIDGLLARLTGMIREGYSARETPFLTRARHREALEATLSQMEEALNASLPELIAESLRLAVRSLGRITGRVDVEDLLDIIFRDFCIGK